VNGLNLYDNMLYAATLDGCAGPNAVYAIDLATDEHAVVKFDTNGAGAAGSAGTAIGNDGTVYVQVAEGRGEVAGQYNDTVVALTPKDLKVKDYFTPSGAVAPVNAALQAGVTPVVFRWNGKDVVVAGSRDGRVFLLDATALGGADHRTPLAQSQPIGAISGAFASWEDPETGARWIYASLPRSSSAGTGAIAAFKLEERNGRPALTLSWTSRDLIAPAAPVVANGLLFALSTGGSTTRATLYALDAATGKELFTSGDTVTRPASAQSAALAVANGRVYFTTQDNTVYSFGIQTEH
jgi:outer membrane protein assembly factor BamB